MTLQGLADDGRHLIGRLDLQVPVIDDADRDLLAGNRLADGLEVQAVVGARLERHHVHVELVQQRQRARVRLVRRVQPLLRRIPPARVAPHLGRVAQALDGAVERIHEELGAEQRRAAAALDARQVDVRLFHLDDGAAGASQIRELGLHRIGQREQQVFLLRVVVVPDRRADEIRHDRPELDRPRGEALRDLPQIRVVQRAALDRPHAARHHAAFHHFEDNVSLARAAVALPGAVVVAAAEALEPPRRVLEPAHAADVAVEPRVAVSDDVEASTLLVADERPDGVRVLFAEARVGDGVAERALTEVLDVPPGPRQRARNRRRQGHRVGRFGHRVRVPRTRRWRF